MCAAVGGPAAAAALLPLQSTGAATASSSGLFLPFHPPGLRPRQRFAATDDQYGRGLGILEVNNNNNNVDVTVAVGPRKTTRKRGTNDRVRAILDLLAHRFHTLEDLVDCNTTTTTTSTSGDPRLGGEVGTIGKNWTKLRNFLYRATTPTPTVSSSISSMGVPKKEGLTIPQVLKVLHFLNETFPDDWDLQRSIVWHSPRILSKPVGTRLVPTVEFLQSLYPGPLFVHAVRRNSDLLLTVGTGYQATSDLELVPVFLRDDLQLTPAHIRRLQTNAPALFQVSMVQLLSVVGFLRTVLLDVAGAATAAPQQSQGDGGDAIPSIESSAVEARQKRATEIIGQLILSHPNIFQLSVSENLQPSLQYFQTRLQLKDTELAALLNRRCGSILGLSIQQNLAPTLELLSGLLLSSSSSSFSRDCLRKAVLAHPPILGLSLGNLRAKIAYFDSIDAMASSSSSSNSNQNRPSLASRVLMRSPTVFSLSLCDNIAPTVEFLAQIWGTQAPPPPNSGSSVRPMAAVEKEERIKLDSKQTKPPTTTIPLVTLLSEYPSILTLSLEGNIQPTVNFYVRSGYLSLDQSGVRQHVGDDYHGSRGTTLVRGRYLAASLFSRLLPRWHYYCQQKQQEVAPPPPIHVLAGTTDESFCEKCGLEYALYAAFKEEAVPRLKFSSQFDTWLHTGRPIDL